MGTSLFGKLFSKELIVKNNIYLHENLVLAEYLFVAEYLHLFTDVNLNSNIYIYEMNAEYLEPGSYSDISREEWAQIFHTLISGETASPAEHYMASSLKKYIERNQIDSVELLYLAEEKIHGLYEVNYTLAQRTLPILWADFIQSGEQEKLELFRNYLQKYDCFLLGTL